MITIPATTPTVSGAADLATARARNEATWRAAALALYAGDIEEFLTHWTAHPTYSVAYPVEGFPSAVAGRDGVPGPVRRLRVRDHPHRGAGRALPPERRS